MKKSRMLALVALAPVSVLPAQVLFTGVYNQNFDTLPTASVSTGLETPTWTNNSTLSGWYAFSGTSLTTARSTVRLDDGGTSNQDLYSFGATGVSERALGLQVVGTTFAVGLRLTNNTGADISSVLISYTGEQWNRGSDADPAFITTTFQFSYAVAPVSLSGLGPNGSFTDFDALDYSANAQLTGTLTSTPLDGNSAANQSTFSGITLSLNTPWTNGSDLWLRWVDVGVSGGIDRANGLAIDDFSLSAATSSVPEPSTYGAIAGVVALVMCALHRRRRMRADRSRIAR